MVTMAYLSQCHLNGLLMVSLEISHIPLIQTCELRYKMLYWKSITVQERKRQMPITKKRERSEEHTSELQSRGHLVCRLLLEKKNNALDSDPDHTVICSLYNVPTLLMII